MKHVSVCLWSAASFILRIEGVSQSITHVGNTWWNYTSMGSLERYKHGVVFSWLLENNYWQEYGVVWRKIYIMWASAIQVTELAVIIETIVY